MKILEARAGGGSTLLPSPETVIPSLDPAKIQVAALIDLGELDPAWAGRKLPILAFFLNEIVRFQEGDDGKWTLIDAWEDTFEWAEPLEGGAQVFSGLDPIPEATLVEREGSASSLKREHGVVLWGGEPDWVQSPDAPGGDFQFAVQMESWYTPGRMFAFYDPQTRRAAFLCQFS